MTKVREIEKAIEALPEPQFEELREWFAQRDWERWDREIEADSKAGRLQFFVEEARDAKKHGGLRDL